MADLEEKMRPKLSPMGRQALSAMRCGIAAAAEQSRRAGIPMVVWRIGRITLIRQ